jgi:hypothetical protein
MMKGDQRGGVPWQLEGHGKKSRKRIFLGKRLWQLLYTWQWFWSSLMLEVEHLGDSPSRSSQSFLIGTENRIEI